MGIGAAWEGHWIAQLGSLVAAARIPITCWGACSFKAHARDAWAEGQIALSARSLIYDAKMLRC